MPPFTEETYTTRFRLGGEMKEAAPMRLYNPEVSRRRTLQPLEATLREAGQWREARAGMLRRAVVRARAVQQAAENVTSRGIFCYKTDECH